MSKRRVAIRAAARRDLTQHYRWLATEAGFEIAERLLDTADRRSTNWLNSRIWGQAQDHASRR